jgi:hypothetical protein
VTATSKPGQADFLEGAFRLLDATPAGELPADALAIAAVEDDYQRNPAVTSAKDVGDVSAH